MEDNEPTLKSVYDNPDELLQYLYKKGKNHNCFKYYSRREIIDSVVRDRYIYLTRGDNWNDLEDRIPFSGSVEGYIRFAMCFSFSVSESVAMWMLYGGITGNGAMVDFTKGDITKMLAQESLEVGYRTNEYGFNVVDTIDDGFKCYAMDVLYCAENKDGTYSIKRSDERVDGLSSLPSVRGILKKSYPWSYENEVRLIVEVPKDMVGGNVDCIRMPIARTSDDMKRRVYLAPNNAMAGTGYNRSTLRGKIEWDLCRGCDRRDSI